MLEEVLSHTASTAADIIVHMVDDLIPTTPREATISTRSLQENQPQHVPPSATGSCSAAPSHIDLITFHSSQLMAERQQMIGRPINVCV